MTNCKYTGTGANVRGYSYNVNDRTESVFSEISDSTLYSDLPPEFIQANQEMLISFPAASIADHKHEQFEQEGDRNMQDASIIQVEMREAAQSIIGEDTICQIQDPPPAVFGIIPPKTAAEIEPTLLQELKSIVANLQCYPQYSKYFLSCERCVVSSGVLRPHCKCGEYRFMEHGGLHGCVQMCPDLTKCTKTNRQLSHCPTCMHIGAGISGHKSLSSLIDVYICANCHNFHSRWNSKNYESKLGNLKCESKVGKKGNCFPDREFGGNPAHFCAWCRLKLMQLLGFKMTDGVKQALQEGDPKHRKLLHPAELDTSDKLLAEISGQQLEQPNYSITMQSSDFEVVSSNDPNPRKRSLGLIENENEQSVNSSKLENAYQKRKKSNDDSDDDQGNTDEVAMLYLNTPEIRSIFQCETFNPNNQGLTLAGIGETEPPLLNSSGPAETIKINDANMDVARIGSTLSTLKLDHDNDFADELKIARGFDDLDDVYTILHDAVKEGNKLRAKLILRRNRVNVNHKTKKGRTPLFYAIFGLKTPDYEMMNFLQREGAEMDIKDNYGITDVIGLDMDPIRSLQKSLIGQPIFDPKKQEVMDEAIEAIESDLTELHIGTKNGEYYVPLTLVKHGSDLSAQTTFGRTPLHFAAMCIRKNKNSAFLYQIMRCEGGF